MTGGTLHASREAARADLLKSLTRRLEDECLVVAAFVTGSVANGTETEFADIDIWLVVDEPELSALLQRLPDILRSCGVVLTIRASHESHITAIYDDLVVLDLTLITVASFRALSHPDRKVLFDRRGAFVDGSSSLRPSEVLTRLVDGAAIATRIASKLEARNYWLIPRFCESMRSASILPLLSTQYRWDAGYPSSDDLDLLPAQVRTRLELTFPKPTRESCGTALIAAIDILDEFAGHALHAEDSPQSGLLATLRRLRHIGQGAEPRMEEGS